MISRSISPCEEYSALTHSLRNLPSNKPMPSKPRLGQNFLNDAQAIQRIAGSLGDLSGRTVIEIGPGAGAITAALIARAAQPLLVFGNLPYYITSQILLKLAASHAALDRCVLMVQREVADRITAQPGSRDYGLLSVTVQLSAPATNLFTLPPAAFSPPPDVHSTVFRWRFAPRFVELGVEESAFLSFVRKVFAQKRKTLSNNLRAAGFAPALIVSALTHSSIDLHARAEQLSIETLAALWNALQVTR